MVKAVQALFCFLGVIFWRRWVQRRGSECNAASPATWKWNVIPIQSFEAVGPAQFQFRVRRGEYKSANGRSSGWFQFYFVVLLKNLFKFPSAREVTKYIQDFGQFCEKIGESV